MRPDIGGLPEAGPAVANWRVCGLCKGSPSAMHRERDQLGSRYAETWEPHRVYLRRHGHIESYAAQFARPTLCASNDRGACALTLERYHATDKFQSSHTSFQSCDDTRMVTVTLEINVIFRC